MADEPNTSTTTDAELTELRGLLTDLRQGTTKASEREGKLVTQLYKRRERTRRLEEEITRLKGLVPGDGAVILTGEDAKTFSAFKALNVKPDVLSARLARADAADAEQAEAARVKAIRDVVEPAGYNGPLFAKFAKSDRFTVSLREQTVDGKKVSEPVAQRLGADGQPEGDALPLDEFAATHLTDVPLETLKARPEPAVVARPVTPYPSQRAAGTPSGGQSKAQRVEEMRTAGEYAAI